MTKQKIKVYIVDDHQVVIDGIKANLKEYPNDFLLVGTATCGKDVLDYLKLHAVDIVILDISMPEMDGLEVLKAIKANHPRVKVLVLTMFDDLKHITEMLQNRASGYVLKNMSSQLIIEALTNIGQGKEYFQKEIGEVALNALKGGEELYFVSSKQAIIQSITPSEAELLGMLSLDMSGDQMAVQTGLSRSTIERRQKNLREKLKIDSEKGLVRFAMENGFAWPK